MINQYELNKIWLFFENKLNDKISAGELCQLKNDYMNLYSDDSKKLKSKFLCNCYINKNTKVLRDLLRMMGYVISDVLHFTISDRIICYNGIAYGVDYPSGAIQESIRCENQTVFLGLAAMNTEDYYMQYVIDAKGQWSLNKKKELSSIFERPVRRATIEEIIERYKDE